MDPIDPGRIEITVETPPIRSLLHDLKAKMLADLDVFFLELESRIITGITVRDADRDDERIGFILTVEGCDAEPLCARCDREVTR